MDNLFSERITGVPRSFIREILKTTVNEEVISFAGGLPNKDLFPVKEIKEASAKALDTSGQEILQYSTSEGYAGLREWISERYATRQGIQVDPENIIITSGSQQGLDLLGKCLVNEGDPVVIEEPGYLGAIQALSIFRPCFHTVPLHFDGMDIPSLQDVVNNHDPKLLYTVPNFQNPSGISHSNEKREEACNILRESSTIIVQDDPYGEIQFSGERMKSYKEFAPCQTILLGSFSKIFVPGFRLGWITAGPEIIEKLLIAKQASDLHTNYFAQRVLHQYLMDNDIDAHVKKINERYARQKQAMIGAMKKYFPGGIKHSDPEGGMFLWVILPEHLSAKVLFDKAIKENVAFVPGDPFYIGKANVNTLRLNFSCVDEEKIEEGIKRLGKIIGKMIK